MARHRSAIPAWSNEPVSLLKSTAVVCLAVAVVCLALVDLLDFVLWRME